MWSVERLVVVYVLYVLIIHGEWSIYVEEYNIIKGMKEEEEEVDGWMA